MYMYIYWMLLYWIVFSEARSIVITCYDHFERWHVSFYHQNLVNGDIEKSRKQHLQETVWTWQVLDTSTSRMTFKFDYIKELRNNTTKSKGRIYEGVTAMVKFTKV